MNNHKNSRTPTAKERGALTRIYGDESNWLGVSTEATKIRRTRCTSTQKDGGI